MIRSQKDNSDKISIKRTVIGIFVMILLTVVLGAVYYLPQVLISPAVADSYCRNVFPKIAFIPNSVNSFFVVDV